MPRPTRLSRGFMLRAAVVLAALVLASVPLPAPAIERWYSRGFYAYLQRVITPLSNLAPVALLDLFAAAVVLTVVARGGRGIAAGRTSVMLRSVLPRLVVFAAAMYLAFLVLWGLNYRRVPLEEKLEFDRSRVTVGGAVALATESVDRMNLESAGAHGTAADGPPLDDAFAGVQRALDSRPVAVVGRPKRSLLGWYFRWAAIDGMTDPFFLEIIINPDVLPVEQPFVIAHEWAHLAGYADESEANLVAWLACIHGDARARYSGWMALYNHIAGALPREDRRNVSARLETGPRADLLAIAARYERSRPVVRRAARNVYDSYLKANRIPEGIANYDAVVQLALGVKFDNGWVPRRKDTR